MLEELIQRDTGVSVVGPEEIISLPLPQTPTTHYFHGAVGGHFSQAGVYENSILILIGVFSVFTIIILLAQCYKLCKAFKKDNSTYYELFNVQLSEVTR